VFDWRGKICLISTDNHGGVTGVRGGGALWVSNDGLRFEPAWTQCAYERIPAYFRGYDPAKARRIYGPDPKLERPKLLMERGAPAWLYAPSGWNVTGGARTVIHALKVNLKPGDGPLPRRTRVACLGDSITFGAGAGHPESESYPARLAGLLGDGFEVRNFGAGGTTLMVDGDKPYWRRDEFRAAREFRPDIVVLMFGANDTCGPPRNNWAKSAAFPRDASEMIQHFKRMDARVIVCLPTPMLPETPTMKPQRRADLTERAPRLAQIRRWWREAAATSGAEVVDLTGTLTADQRSVTDGVHPTAQGYERIAGRIRDGIEGRVLTVMSFNVLEAGADSPASGFPDSRFGGGRRDDIANVIRGCGVDIAGVQECGDVAWLLKELGPEWHGFGTGASKYASAIVSRLPLVPLLSEEFLTAARVQLPAGELIVVNAHWWPPANSGAGLIRERMKAGTVPADMAEFERQILAASDAGKGPRGYDRTLEVLRTHLAAGAKLVLTGDFNESSHLDWTERAAESGIDRWPGNPTGRPLRFKIGWMGSKLMAGAGLRDAYRVAYPDEVAKPGITWTPPYEPSPGRRPYEEQVLERIDRIHFSPGGLKVLDAAVVGEDPATCEQVHVGRWVSDHRAVKANLSMIGTRSGTENGSKTPPDPAFRSINPKENPFPKTPRRDLGVNFGGGKVCDWIESTVNTHSADCVLWATPEQTLATPPAKQNEDAHAPPALP
jgi:lysophospholipase L1-like esterase